MRMVFFVLKMFQDECNRDYFQWLEMDYICAVIASCLLETSYSFIQKYSATNYSVRNTNQN